MTEHLERMEGNERYVQEFLWTEAEEKYYRMCFGIIKVDLYGHRVFRYEID